MLEAAGIVTREPDPDDQRQVIYRATAKGRSLVPVLLEIAAWGATWDARTDAPAGFAESFYQDRKQFYARYGDKNRGSTGDPSETD
jgi:DNA-binding MarR family transcriptional regulator